ncbi:Glyco_transf_8 domain-containing protein [Cephalotus follicularis]|uniref:Hexosyltransferase n=1 Tax=Cephalotus follicularis TaxID=3775 RepID=A0A1Q3BVZ0_CEPFO|nr:Glyco_transf_8 domain-containing protein [Cephalotus follicularis]
MKKVRRWQRILILAFLSVSVVTPIVLVSQKLKNLSSIGRKEFIEDLSTIKYRSDANRLKAIEQEGSEGLKEPRLDVFEDKDFGSVVSYSSNENLDSEQSENAGDTTNFLERNVSATNHERKEEVQQIQAKTVMSKSDGKEKSNQTTVQRDQTVRSHLRTDEKVKEMEDQLIRAKAYLHFAPPGSNSHLVKELKLRIKEVERALGEATKDSDLSSSALQKMKSMEASLIKASHVYPDCSAMASKLRAMTYNAEEQLRVQKNQADYLVQLAGRTTPKGLHCLSMRLTAEYFALQSDERQLLNQQKLNDPDLHHYAVFSDNVLACAVVVNSTVSFSMEPKKIVFHVVTDSLNLPAISMWFLSNPPGKATIQIQSIENFEWLSAKYNSTMKKQNSHDPRYTSALNHLRFYLPEVFPELDKILLLDHDVVVQRDLSGIWSVNMEGKVNGAVETCQENDPSFRKMDMFMNFSDPFVAKRFDVKACTWAFGMNLFDLQEWRRQNLTAIYNKYLQLGYTRPLWKAGSLPLGLVTFYNHTVALDRRWHILGLGYDSGVRRDDIQRGAVIHYDGVLKPWLEIGIKKYKGYWSKHVNHDHHYLQQCNIHE